jgi:hypothetical protein
MTQLFVNSEQYAYLRSAPEERVLVVLNRAGRSEPIELDVDDLGCPDGLQFLPFGGGAPVTVSQSKILLPEPKEVNIYWSRSK